MKTFIFIACIIATAMAAPYGDFTPPVSGTWIINTTTRVEGDHTINGDVEVTADLIIVGATLTHDGPSGFNYTWTVSNDASVSINGSTLTVPDESDGAWSLTTEASDASLIIETSTLIFGDTTHGVSTGAKDIYIVGSTLQHGANGVANLTSTENFNHEKGWTLLMLAHTSDEALLNTSSAVIIDTVIRTAVPFESEDDDGDDCDWAFSNSYCEAVEALDMTAYSLVGSIRGVGRSHVSIVRSTALPLGLFLYSGDDERVLGTIDIQEAAFWEVHLTNADRISIQETDIYKEMYLERSVELDEDDVAKTNLTLTSSTFAPDNCAELKMDYGVAGRIEDCQFANPVVTGFLWRYGPDGKFGWNDQRRRSGDHYYDDDWEEEWEEEWDDEDWDSENEEWDCYSIDEYLSVCGADFTGDVCNAPWFWALIATVIASVVCGCCVLCVCCCCLLHCIRSIFARKSGGKPGASGVHHHTHHHMDLAACCNDPRGWYGGRTAAPGDSAMKPGEGLNTNGSPTSNSSAAPLGSGMGQVAPPPPAAPSNSSEEKQEIYPSA